ncbi:MAG: hypothetical protein JW767_05865 [Thermoleophilia bacterium]|nr:hypothetical protein [Thermoleophilia bacterium]
MSSQALRPASARPARTVALFALLLLALLVAPAVASAETAGGAQAEWTFAVYVAADNNLESSWDDVSLPALLGVPASADVHIVALVDRLSTQGAELIEFEGGAQNVVQTYPESNMGDGATFQWFLDKVASDYPSRNLAVTMWDHGYAWRYVCQDDTSDGDRITMPELRVALAGADVDIDILAFDACAMADIAVAYELALADTVDYMLASEAMVPLDGYAYDLMLAPLADDPSRSPEQLLADMLAGWGAYYAPLSWAKYTCLSAVDVRLIGEATPALKDWAAALTAGLPADQTVYREVLKKVWRPSSTRQYDLIGLAEGLAADPALAGKPAGAASAAAADAVAAAVVGTSTTRWSAEARGLTVWWGNKGDWNYYAEAFGAGVTFALPVDDGGVGWYELLDAYNAD